MDRYFSQSYLIIHDADKTSVTYVRPPLTLNDCPEGEDHAVSGVLKLDDGALGVAGRVL